MTAFWVLPLALSLQALPGEEEITPAASKLPTIEVALWAGPMWARKNRDRFVLGAYARVRLADHWRLRIWSALPTKAIAVERRGPATSAGLSEHIQSDLIWYGLGLEYTEPVDWFELGIHGGVHLWTGQNFHGRSAWPGWNVGVQFTVPILERSGMRPGLAAFLACDYLAGFRQLRLRDPGFAGDFFLRTSRRWRGAFILYTGIAVRW